MTAETPVPGPLGPGLESEPMLLCDPCGATFRPDWELVTVLDVAAPLLAPETRVSPLVAIVIAGWGVACGAAAAALAVDAELPEFALLVAIGSVGAERSAGRDAVAPEVVLADACASP